MSWKLIAAATASALLGFPGAASAMHAPGDTSTGARPAAVPNYLGDGKYLLPSPARVQVVRVVSPTGFRLRDAGVGAAIGAVVVATLFGALVFRQRPSSLGAPSST
jgi:hypothetical protein